MIQNNVTNTFEASGRLVSKRELDEKNIIFTIFCNNGKKESFIKIVCEKSMFPECNLRQRLHITGTVEPYYVVSRKAKKRVPSQRFYASTVEMEKTLTETVFGVRGKFYPANTIEVYLKGIVDKVVNEGEWLRISLNVGTNEKKKLLPVNYKKSERAVSISEGTQLCAVCGVVTPRQEYDGATLYFEDLLVQDIAVIKD